MSGAPARQPMFLFTDAPVGTRETGTAATAAGRPAASGEVVDAIRDGAQNTGIGFDYLLATAQRESSLDPTAKAATSSATGLFQFIDQTWLGVMKNAGGKLGLSSYADAITARGDGTFTVADPSTRQAILDLRRDPKVAATMAGVLTQRNREALTASLGREPTSGDLYAAHVLGAKGAATLIASAQTSPARAAATDLPDAATANRNLFYDKTGRPRGSAELYAVLATSTAGGRPAVAAASSLPDATASDLTTSYASLDGGLRSLFQTDKRQGAISEGVAKLWQSRATASTPDAQRSEPSYFPRSDTSQETVMPERTAPVSKPESKLQPKPLAGAAAGDGASILVPLPPRRPTAFTTDAGKPAAQATQPAVPDTAAPGAIPLRRTIPLDLSSYTLRSGT